MENDNNPQPMKWWIRRHRILALLAPFMGMVVLLFLWNGIGMLFIDRIPTENPLKDLCECVWFFLVLATVGVTRVFEMGPEHLAVYRWLSWPFFILPAILYLVLKRTCWAIAAYTVYCLLVCLGIMMGFVWAVSQTIWVQ